jgi:hypothetical protein
MREGSGEGRVAARQVFGRFYVGLGETLKLPFSHNDSLLLGGML